MKILGDGDRGWVLGGLGLFSGGDAGQYDRAVEPGPRGAAEVGVQPVADYQRAASAKTTERGHEDLALEYATNRTAKIAPVPGQRPPSAGNVASRFSAISS